MSTDLIRYGIIGVGMMGWEHILNIALTPNARVTAFADPHEPSRQVAQTLTGAEATAYTDYRQLLREAPVDAVVIATPNYTHHEVLRDVFRTNKHILVEKPLCTTVEDCERVVDAAAVHSGVVWVGMEYRYMQAVAALLDAVRGGQIGHTRMISIREHRFPFLPKVNDWNRFARNTGGTLVEKCCHFFDLMNVIAARRPVRVYASGAQDLNHLDERYGGERPDILDNAFTLVDYAGGVRAMLDLCIFAENSLHEVEITVTGDLGKAQAFEPDHELVLCKRDGSAHERRCFTADAAALAAGTHHGSTYYEHLAFQDAVRNRKAPTVSAEDGALAVALGVAAEQSARLHRPVDLSELGF